MIRKLGYDRGLIAAYRQGLGLAAVAVMCGPEQTRIIAVAAGAEDSAAAGEAAAARWWCRRVTDAELIVAAARRSLRRESNARSGESADGTYLSRATAAVIAAAKTLGVFLQSDEDIAAEAMAVAARIEAELQRQQQSGGLKAVNQAYRAYRLDSRARGERVLRYDEWMANYKETLVRQVALTLRHI